MSTLEIKDLYAHVETKDGIKPILKGVNLTVNSGETHAIMGPNGSGKSTLAYTLAGHPKYVVDSGQVLLDGEDILKMTPDERAKAGIFLAMQYPVEVPGVSMTNFLRTAKTEVDGKAPAIRKNRSRRQGSGHPHVDQGTVRGDEAPEDGSEVRHPFRERGFLRRREEACRSAAARTAQAEVRHPRRNRLRP